MRNIHDCSPWRPPFASAAALSIHAAAPAWLAAAPEAWPLVAATLAGTHAAITVANLFPGNQLFGPTITRLPGQPEAVALSFDDGPDPDVTPRVLDLLDRHDARASFFMIGARAARHPALVREVARRGHHVENHTMRHLHRFALLGLRAQRRELADAQAVLTSLTGRAPVLARTPAGIRSPLTDPVLHGLGLRHASWSRRGLDTRTEDGAAVLRRLSRNLHAGDILLLHDGNPARDRADRPVVLDVLAALLRLMDRMGLNSIPVAQGLGSANAAKPARVREPSLQ